MKTFTHIIFTACLLFSVLLPGISSATSYTAKASGKWSDSATWNGGSIPPFKINGDQVSIPSGIDVTAKGSIMVSGLLSSLDVKGSLTDSTDSLVITGVGALTGSGKIKFNTVVFSGSSVVLYSGNLLAKTLVAAHAVNIYADVMVSNSLMLDSGVVTMQSGSKLAFGYNATIYIKKGSLDAGSGSVDMTTRYNVYYRNNSSTIGNELSGTGITDVTMNVGTNNSLTLVSDLKVKGTLYLMNGTLVLAGHDLILYGNIGIYDSLTNYVNSTSASSIYFYLNSYSAAGSLHFSPSGNTIGKIVMNAGNDSDLSSIGSYVKVTDSLIFKHGRIKMTNGSTLEIANTCQVVLNKEASYIVATNGNYVKRALGNTDTSLGYFPIGTFLKFAPAQVSLAKGSSDGSVWMSVMDGVLTQANTGDLISKYQPAVNATWNLFSDITSKLNLSLTTYWSNDMEVNNFDRTHAYISHYTGTWDTLAGTASSTYTSGLHSITRRGITSLSPFAVFDNSTRTGIAEEVNIANDIKVYPNPANDYLNLNIGNGINAGTGLNMQILDMTGRIISNQAVATGTNNINISSFKQGNYVIKVYNDHTNIVMKFNKI